MRSTEEGKGRREGGRGFELSGGNFSRPSSGRKAMDDDTPLPVS